MPASLLSPLTADQRRLARREALRFGHALADTGLFADESLIQLLDLHPRSRTRILTRRPDGSPRDGWMAGAADKATGAQLLKAIGAGALSVTLEDVMSSDPACRLVFDQLAAELHDATGLMVMAAQASIVISSPRLAAPLSIAPREAAALTVRGGQVLYVYPAGPQAGLPWTPAREDTVTPVILQAGQAAFWPSQSPTRSVNGEEIIVSVTFTFETPQSMLADVLRRALGQPSPAACAKTDLTPRFDVGPKGLVWREGLAPDWAPAPRKAVRRRTPAAKALKAA
ncbi:MAG: hypothetical protein Q8J89_00995 [Caulobacter sp.]|nr:hypothetical protein [Caulobacter sp.]